MKGHLCLLASASMIHAQRWANYFASHNWSVDLITWRPPMDGFDTRIRIHKIRSPPHYIFIITALVEIFNIVRDIKPDLIHAHDAATFGVLAGLLKDLNNLIPIIITAMGSDILISGHSYKEKWILHSLKNADLITCEGKKIKDAMIELGADAKKISKINWGIDCSKFSPDNRSQDLRKELGVNDSPMIISSKGFQPVYDIKTLILSVPLIIEKAPSAQIVIAGKGPQEKELKQLAKSLCVSENIKFIGYISPEEYPKYIASADIYVCTCILEGGFAVSTKEAMSCGLPVIITDLVDNIRWINDGVNGFIIPKKDYAQLATKVLFLIEHQEARATMGSKGITLVRENFEFDGEMEKMDHLYIDLIRNKKI